MQKIQTTTTYELPIFRINARVFTEMSKCVSQGSELNTSSLAAHNFLTSTPSLVTSIRCYILTFLNLIFNILTLKIFNKKFGIYKIVESRRVLIFWHCLFSILGRLRCVRPYLKYVGS